jgi:hypothetical protein
VAAALSSAAVGDEFLILQGIDACTGWIGGLVLLVVGFVAVRAASSRAGLLLAGAGGAKLLLNCCAIASLYFQTVGYSESAMTASEAVSAVSMLLWLVVYGLVIAAAVVLAKDVIAARAGSVT